MTALLWSASTARASDAVAEETWYRVEVDGQPAGSLHIDVRGAGELLHTSSDMRLTFTRHGQAQSLEMSSRFTESVAGAPIRMSTRQQLGPAPVVMEYVFEADHVTEHRGDETRRRPRPEGPWLAPAAAQRELELRVERALEAVAAGRETKPTFEIHGLDPSLGIEPIITRWQLEKPSVLVEIDGQSHRVSRWQQSQSYAPGIVSQVDLDDRGRMVRSQARVMGLEMTTLLSTREAVQSSGDGPEILVSSFIYPDRVIPQPRQLRRAVYRLTVQGGAGQLPTVGYQSSTEDRVIVDLDAPAAVEAPSAQALDRLLAPSTYLTSDDPAIRALHRRALSGVGDSATPAQRAEALRRFVGQHLSSKNLDSVLATASQAAASRSGDCTEHAVLLGALLRVDGIPARVATGVIYADRFAGEQDLFAYHMWTQAYLDGRFVDLDATLDGATAFDAAHITFGIPDLDDEGAAVRHMAALAPLMGRTRIEVLEIGRGTSAP